VDPQPFVVGRQLPIDGAGSPRSASVRPLGLLRRLVNLPFCWSGQTETARDHFNLASTVIVKSMKRPH